MRPIALVVVCCLWTVACARAPGAERRADAVVATRVPPDVGSGCPGNVGDPAGGPLRLRDAVRCGLARNPGLRSAWAEIGIAQAEWVQAGLWPNPVLDAAFMVETGAGSGVKIEYGLVQGLIDALRAPLRRRVAAADLDAAVFRAADAALETVAEVEVAFQRVQGRTRVLEARRRSLLALDTSAELARRQVEAGNAPEEDRLLAEAALAESRLEVSGAESAVLAARAELARLLDVPVERTEGIAALPEPVVESAVPDAAALAVTERLDLRAQRAKVEARRRAVGLPRVPETLGAGVRGEKEPSGEHVVGPAIEVEVPVFDTGRARRMRAVAELRKAEADLAAAEARVRSEALVATDEVRRAAEAARVYATQVLPSHRRRATLLMQRYHAMLVGTPDLLKAKREEMDAEARAAEAVERFWIARARLGRALGRPFPFVEAPGGP